MTRLYLTHCNKFPPKVFIHNQTLKHKARLRFKFSELLFGASLCLKHSNQSCPKHMWYGTPTLMYVTYVHIHTFLSQLVPGDTTVLWCTPPPRFTVCTPAQLWVKQTNNLGIKIQLLFVLKTWSHCVALARLEVTKQTLLTLNSQNSICFCFPGAGVKGVHHPAWQKIQYFFLSTFKCAFLGQDFQAQS